MEQPGGASASRRVHGRGQGRVLHFLPEVIEALRAGAPSDALCQVIWLELESCREQDHCVQARYMETSLQQTELRSMLAGEQGVEYGRVPKNDPKNIETMRHDRPAAERGASAQQPAQPHTGPGRGRLLLGGRASVVLGIPLLCLFFVAPASAATQAPEVQWEAASRVSTTDATAEASIDPEGGETSYEIWLECGEAPGIDQQCEPLTANPQRHQGTLSPVSEPVIVTDAVTGLQPGTFYKYRVVATNSAGRSGIVGAGFRTCPSTGPCPMQPYAPGEALWNLEGAEREAQEAPRLEAEREAKHREEEERPAKEAAERAAKEREIREAGERAGREQAERTQPSGSCVVPRLAGDSPKVARRSLRRAHCGVGSVVKPRVGGHLVVVGQSVPGGVKRPPGFKVRVTFATGGKRP